jgi:hypothetical protein
MCGYPYLDRPSVLTATRISATTRDALHTFRQRSARAPQKEAPILSPVHDSQFTSHELLLTNHAFLIGFAAIRSRRNALKTNGGLSC